MMANDALKDLIARKCGWICSRSARLVLVTMGCDQGGPAWAPGCRDRTTSCPRRLAAAAWVSLLLRQPLLLHRRSGGWQVAVRGEARKRSPVSNCLQWFRSRARRPAAICFTASTILHAFATSSFIASKAGPAGWRPCRKGEADEFLCAAPGSWSRDRSLGRRQGRGEARSVDGSPGDLWRSGRSHGELTLGKVFPGNSKA